MSEKEESTENIDGLCTRMVVECVNKATELSNNSRTLENTDYDPEYNYQCGECGKTFSNMNFIQKHMEQYYTEHQLRNDEEVQITNVVKLQQRQRQAKMKKLDCH